MPSRKTYNPSRNFSVSILAIGAISLIGAVLFAHAMENVHLAASIASRGCDGNLQMCLKSAEADSECAACLHSADTITSKSCQACAAVKASCQNEYNACTDQGGKIYGW